MDCFSRTFLFQYNKQFQIKWFEFKERDQTKIAIHNKSHDQEIELSHPKWAIILIRNFSDRNFTLIILNKWMTNAYPSPVNAQHDCICHWCFLIDVRSNWRDISAADIAPFKSWKWTTEAWVQNIRFLSNQKIH